MRTDFFPGWKMTRAQHGEYFRTWAAIVEKYGWNKVQAEEQRQLAHTRAFGFVKSRKDIDHLNDYTKIKAEFMALLHPEKLAPVLKQETMPETNLRHKVMFDQVKLLSVVLPEMDGATCPAREVVPDLEWAQCYVAGVMRDRFRTEDIHAVSDQRPHPDGYSELEKLVFTLDRCISELRRKRIPKGMKGHDCGWMVHDLKRAAGVSCDCAKCRAKPAMKMEVAA
jgi:hypothetical protein